MTTTTTMIHHVLKKIRLKQQTINSIYRRNLTTNTSSTVYTMGEGWTGALGTSSLATYQHHQFSSPDHLTYEDDRPDNDSHYDASNGLIPVTIPPTTTTTGSDSPTIISAAAGWGHSLLVDSRNKLYLSGRPHDFQSILRLKRLPYFVRDPLIYYTQSPSTTSQTFNPNDDEEAYKRSQCLFDSFVPILTEKAIRPGGIAASAGMSAVVTMGGEAYSWGVNHYGQAGTGRDSRNVWVPSLISGLNKSIIGNDGGDFVPQDNPVKTVALGLQHGLALMENDNRIYTWGKATRGQLGNVLVEDGGAEIDCRAFGKEVRGGFSDEGGVSKIACGYFHCAVLSQANRVYVWGKGLLPGMDGKKKVRIAERPFMVRGLPEHLKVVELACGSHHTSMLLEDGSVYAIGISTDNATPILEEAIEIIPKGVVNMPCQYFGASFDRSVVVGKGGRQVLEVQLWSHEELRRDADFVPRWWKDFRHDEANKNMKVRMVKRGWLHSLIVMDNSEMTQ